MIIFFILDVDHSDAGKRWANMRLNSCHRVSSGKWVERRPVALFCTWTKQIRVCIWVSPARPVRIYSRKSMPKCGASMFVSCIGKATLAVIGKGGQQWGTRCNNMCLVRSVSSRCTLYFFGCPSIHITHTWSCAYSVQWAQCVRTRDLFWKPPGEIQNGKPLSSPPAVYNKQIKRPDNDRGSPPSPRPCIHRVSTIKHKCDSSAHQLFPEDAFTSAFSRSS